MSLVVSFADVTDGKVDDHSAGFEEAHLSPVQESVNTLLQGSPVLQQSEVVHQDTTAAVSALRLEVKLFS